MSRRAIEAEIRQTLHPMLREAGYTSSSGLRRIRKHQDFFLVWDVSVRQTWDEHFEATIGYDLRIDYFVGLRSLQRLPWIDPHGATLAPALRPVLPSESQFSTCFWHTSPAIGRVSIGFYLDNLRNALCSLRDQTQVRATLLASYDDWAAVNLALHRPLAEHRENLFQQVAEERGLLPTLWPRSASAAIAWLVERGRIPEAIELAKSDERWCVNDGVPPDLERREHWSSVVARLSAV